MRYIQSCRNEDSLLFTLNTNTSSVVRNNLIYVVTNSQTSVNIAVLSTRSQSQTSFNLNLLDTSLLARSLSYVEDNLISQTCPCTSHTINSQNAIAFLNLKFVSIYESECHLLDSRSLNSQCIVRIHTKGSTRSIVFWSIVTLILSQCSSISIAEVDSSNILLVLIALFRSSPRDRILCNIFKALNNSTVTEHVNLSQICQISTTNSLGRSLEWNNSLQHIGSLSNCKVCNSCRSSRLSTSLYEEISNHQSELVCITDSVDTEVVVASLSNCYSIVFVCYIVSWSNFCSSQYALCKSRSLSLSTNQHLKSLQEASVLSINREVVLLTSLQLNSGRNQPVVSIVCRIITIEYTIRSIKIPCATILVAINYTKVSK